MNVKRLLVIPNFLRAVPALCFYAGCNTDIKNKVRKDVARNSENHRFTIFELVYCLIWNKPFRNILYFRYLEQWPVVSRLMWFLIPPRSDIEISGNIGGGARYLAWLRHCDCMSFNGRKLFHMARGYDR